jgi:ribosomal protein S18 acetylase RimI-like enzyme
MNELGTLTKPRVHLKKPDRLRLPQLLTIEQQAPAPCWSQQDFLAAFRAAGAGLAVAEGNGCIVGFVLYKIMSPSAVDQTGRLVRFLDWCPPWLSSVLFAPRDRELLRIGVLPDWRRQGIGRALLQEIHQAFGPGGCIRAVVPESNLPVLLLLREASYKAIRILPGHFGSDDGYLMERRGG